MRDQAQASVETIGLMAAAAALAAVLVLGVVRLGPPVASALGHALTGIVAPAAPKAPGLDGLERALLAAATSTGADGPTLLDVRTRLRSRLDRSAADAAFDAAVRPLIADTLVARSITSRPGTIAIVDRAAEDAWVRDRLGADTALRVVELAGIPGAALSIARDLNLGADAPADALPAGHAAGDVVVQFASGGYSKVVLRRRPELGLTVIRALFGSRPAYAGRR